MKRGQVLVRGGGVKFSGWLACMLIACWPAAQAQVPSNPFSYTRTSAFTYFEPTHGAKSGLLRSEIIEPDNPQLCSVTTYDYDSYGNKQSATTSNCAGASGRAAFATRTASTTYASHSVSIHGVSVAVAAGAFPATATNALNQSEGKTFDPRSGGVLTLTGPNNLTTRWEYDDFGRKVKEIRADGTKTFTWHCVIAADLSAASNSVIDGIPCPASPAGAPADAVAFVHSEPRDASSATGVKMGPFQQAFVDRLGREIRSVTESFDGAAQPSARRGALIAKDTVYNEYGAKILQTQPYFLASRSSTTGGTNDVGVTRTDYDVLGRPVAIYVADPEGSQTGVAFGTYGTRTAARQTVAYNGQSLTRINDKGQARTEEKNAQGEIVRVTDATGAQLVHQRDAFGNLVATKDALQNTIRTVYDIRGRKVQMNDPDTGTWGYDYDALGQLVWQQSANQRTAGTQTTMSYDVLGRMTSRVEPEYVSTWSYDRYANASACPRGVGKLCESTTSHGVTRKLVYDDFGRAVSSRTDVANGPSFATAMAYHPVTGRVASQTYPTGVQVRYDYSARGYLDQLVLGTAATVNPLPATPGGAPGAGTTLASGSVLWQARAVNAWDKTEQHAYGNGVLTTAGFDAATGRATQLSAGAAGSSTVLSHSYTWDSLNNLVARIDHNGDGGSGAVSETFTYGDALNRLTRYQVAAPAIPGLSRTVNLQYNALGMLLYKSDVGIYSYGPQGPASVRPHALQGVAGAVNTSYTYDGNGNLIGASAGKYRSIAYTSFNLPDHQNGIRGLAGGAQYTWQYDENHARIKESHTDAAGTRTTWYLHPDNRGGLGFEREIAPSGAASNRHYLTVGGAAIGVLVSTGALPALSSTQTVPPSLAGIALVKVEYWHKDHLGSLAATTDHGGAVTQRYAYDPFGKRRYTNGRYDDQGNLVIDWSSSLDHGTDRGYTGHEHLDDVGLVHMNGRIFDPTLGVFLQGDPFIQDPYNLQNYNRYGYCYNNPLTCTDPSGQSFEVFMYFVAAIVAARVTGIIDTRTARSLLAVAVAYYLGPTGGFFQGTYTAGHAAVAGFVSGAISTGTFQGGVQGMFTGIMFFGVGQAIPSESYMSAAGKVTDAGLFMKHVALHAAVGCVTSAAGGGKCAAGAASAGFAKFATPVSAGLGPVGGTISSAIVGGTASELGGGKFANGAMTGAFGYIFNHLGSSPEDSLTPDNGPGLRITLENVSNFAAGVGDTLSFGGTAAVRDWLSIGSVDSSSGAYSAGEVAGVGVGVATGGAGLRAVAGPIKQWIRVGPSYSHSLQVKTSWSVRWGASPVGGGKYIKQIPSPTLQRFNQWLRAQKLPFNGWRSADPGHFHLKQ